MMKWFLGMSLLISVNAHAFLTTLMREHPIVGVESIHLSTVYDKEQFDGYITQGIKYTYIPGQPFFVLFEETHYTLSEALAAHQRARTTMISFYLHSLTNEQSMAIVRQDDDGEISISDLSDISNTSIVDSPKDYPFVISDDSDSGDESSDEL